MPPSPIVSKLMTVLLVIFAAVTSGCGTTRPEATPEQVQERWRQIATSANQDYTESLEAAFRRMERASQTAAKPEDATFDVLAVHAGGPASAFSAGILYGWQEVEEPEYRLPDFDVVTGASAGSLVAPFAFIGDQSAYQRVAQLFCDIPEDLFGSPSVTSVWPTRSSLVSSDRLRQLIEAEMNPAMIAGLARGHEQDRDLLVVSADLDFGVMRAWRLAEEASVAQSSGDPTRLHNMLMASTSVPVAFPPVELDGSLHTDGGVAASALFGFGSQGLLELAQRWSAAHPGVPMPRIRLWMIINRQLSAGYDTVQPRYLEIALRSNDISMEYDRYKILLYLVNLFARLDGQQGLRMDFRWITIPWEVAMPSLVDLRDTSAVRGLVDYGADLARNPDNWREDEPQAEWFNEDWVAAEPLATEAGVCSQWR